MLLSVKDRLDLVRMDYELRGVKALFLRDYDNLPTPGGILSARRGDEIELPRWQAALLASKGVVEVKDSSVDIDYINMYHFREKKKAGANELSQLPQDFYMKAGELVERLDRLIRESPSHMLFRDRDVLERNLMELAESRLAKLLRLAQSGSEEFKERMTPEEALVYKVIRDTIESWRGYIRSKTQKRGGGEG
ncbi:MAG: DNA replication complex GINS family protein [Desulfurococcales archaeon]|nr:DNA replication complex GINS family protein [Desulfurococcales archaeon]